MSSACFGEIPIGYPPSLDHLLLCPGRGANGSGAGAGAAPPASGLLTVASSALANGSLGSATGVLSLAVAPNGSTEDGPEANGSFGSIAGVLSSSSSARLDGAPNGSSPPTAKGSLGSTTGV